jgi:hypothetical protein
MRRTNEQLELDAVEANRFREQRRRLEIEMTPDRVERLESAVYGSTYTNPEVTASIGLSDVPIDARLVHEHTARRALETGNASNNRENLVKPRNRAMRPTPTAKEWNLYDLLQTPNFDFTLRRHLQPSWWDEVDPGGFWRSLQVPEITDAKQLLDLEEAQVIKLLLSTTEQQWNAIPGMVPVDDTKTTTSATLPTAPAEKIATTVQNLKTKFPHVKEILEFREETKTPTPGFSVDWAGLGQGALGTLQAPFKLMSFIVPDKIGSEKEVLGAGLNLGIKDITEPLATAVRGVSKAAAAAFLGAAQFTKTALELGLTAPRSGLGIATAPMVPWEKVQQGLIEGNILTQIARRAINPNQEVDLGGGYFPEGIALTEARKNRDASLPQVGGQSFTVGRAINRTSYPRRLH